MLEILKSHPELCAAFGAVAIKFLEIAEVHRLPKPDRPDFKDWAYWVSFIIMAGLGGMLAEIYTANGFNLEPVIAMNIGISAPLTLRAFAQTNPFKSSMNLNDVEE